MKKEKTVRMVFLALFLANTVFATQNAANAQSGITTPAVSVYSSFPTFLQRELNVPLIGDAALGLRVSLHLGAHAVPPQKKVGESSDHRFESLEFFAHEQIYRAVFEADNKWKPSGRAVFLLTGGDQASHYGPALEAIERATQATSTQLMRDNGFDASARPQVWVGLILSEAPDTQTLSGLSSRGVNAIIVQNAESAGQSGRSVEIDFWRALSGARNVDAGQVLLWGGGDREYQRAAEWVLRAGDTGGSYSRGAPWGLNIFELQAPHSILENEHATKTPDACVRLLHALGGGLLPRRPGLAVEVMGSTDYIGYTEPFDQRWREAFAKPGQFEHRYLPSFADGGMSASAIEAERSRLERTGSGGAGQLYVSEKTDRMADLAFYELYARDTAKLTEPVALRVIMEQSAEQRRLKATVTNPYSSLLSQSDVIALLSRSVQLEGALDQLKAVHEKTRGLLKIQEARKYRPRTR